MFPAGFLVYFVVQFWERARDSSVRHAIEKGFAPLTVGLVLASGYVMSKAADQDWRAYLLTGICTLIFVFTKVNPLIVVAIAGFWAGWVLFKKRAQIVERAKGAIRWRITRRSNSRQSVFRTASHSTPSKGAFDRQFACSCQRFAKNVKLRR